MIEALVVTLAVTGAVAALVVVAGFISDVLLPKFERPKRGASYRRIK